MHHFKYYKDKQLAWALGYLLFPILDKILLSDIDMIIPVPLHNNKYRERGFNQSSELLNYYRAVNNSIVVNNLIVSRHKDTTSQVTMSRLERELNLSDAFTVNKSVHGAKVLIVDDVVTTGATVNSLAKVLKHNGAIKVEVCCLMRA